MSSTASLSTGISAAKGAATSSGILLSVAYAIPSFGWLILSALFFGVGEYLSKRWVLSPSWPLAVAVVLVDLLATSLWLPALFHRNQLAIVGLMWLLLGAVMTLSIGLFVFKEMLTWTQWAGIACAMVALILLEQ